MTPPARSREFAELCRHTQDLGNIRPLDSLAESQMALGRVVACALRLGAIPIVVGGGHETAYGHFLGYAEAGLQHAIINLDAHADVRGLKDGTGHSGSPFRQAIEHSSGLVHSYSILGLQRSAVAASHADFVRVHGGTCSWVDEVNAVSVDRAFAAQAPASSLFATLCLDAVDGAQAPGVSAPSVGGLPASIALRYAYRAGRSANLRSFEIAELNPAFDVDGRSARLGARLVWTFLRGLSEAEV